MKSAAQRAYEAWRGDWYGSEDDRWAPVWVVLTQAEQDTWGAVAEAVRSGEDGRTYEEGYNEGFSDGHDRGYADAEDDND